MLFRSCITLISAGIIGKLNLITYIANWDGMFPMQVCCIVNAIPLPDYNTQTRWPQSLILTSYWANPIQRHFNFTVLMSWLLPFQWKSEDRRAMLSELPQNMHISVCMSTVKTSPCRIGIVNNIAPKQALNPLSAAETERPSHDPENLVVHVRYVGSHPFNNYAGQMAVLKHIMCWCSWSC